MDQGAWGDVLTCCEDCLYLWKHTHRFPFHPKVVPCVGGGGGWGACMYVRLSFSLALSLPLSLALALSLSVSLSLFLSLCARAGVHKRVPIQERSRV